jgi:hypothetical protein
MASLTLWPTIAAVLKWWLHMLQVVKSSNASMNLSDVAGMANWQTQCLFSCNNCQVANQQWS